MWRGRNFDKKIFKNLSKVAWKFKSALGLDVLWILDEFGRPSWRQNPLKMELKTIWKNGPIMEDLPSSPRQAWLHPSPPTGHLETHIFRRKSFLRGFLEPKLEAKARSSQATAVREVAKSCRKSAICLDFKEGVYVLFVCDIFVYVLCMFYICGSCIYLYIYIYTYIYRYI